MSHTFSKIWLHVLWSTKHRQPLISQKLEPALYDFIKNEFEEMGCKVSAINGVADHIHCLILISPQKSISDLIKQAKGSSSHFVNHSDLISEKFAWQTGFTVFSVSESIVPKVRAYIQNQKVHHGKQTAEDELVAFLKMHEIEGENG